MARYAMNPDDRRRRQRALSNTGQRQTQAQYGQGGGYGTGFVPQGRTQVQYGGGQAQPKFSHQQLAGNYNVNIPATQVRRGRGVTAPAGGGGPNPNRWAGPSRQSRYGQQRGFGQGYIAPRRSLGDQHRTAPQRTAASAGRGYNPRTSAQMYGGRPRGVARPRQMNQMQAMTRPAVGAGTYVGRPYGGTNAVTRRRW